VARVPLRRRLWAALVRRIRRQVDRRHRRYRAQVLCGAVVFMFAQQL
jgi:hypothetical protein